VLVGQDRRIMRARTSGGLSRALTWLAAGAMTAAALALVGTLPPVQAVVHAVR
jgi:hypothetical protein